MNVQVKVPIDQIQDQVHAEVWEGGSGASFPLPVLHLILTYISKSQLSTYPCPSNISFLYNYGFLLNICIILQLITGIYLSIHYIPIISYSFFIPIVQLMTL